jgi:TolA-binding protein
VDKEFLEILKNIQGDIKNIQGDIKTMQGDINTMQGDIKDIKTRQEETYQLVKALEHSAEVNKAEHDKMANDVAHIKGDVEALRKDISTVEIVTANNYADIAKLKAIK